MSEISKAIGNIFQPGKLVDVTPMVNVIQNKWGLLNAMGLFNSEYKSQKLVQVNRETESVALLEDRNWNERKPVLDKIGREYTIVPIPHLPVQGIITPTDVDGNVDIEALFQGQISVPLSVQKVVAKEMTRMRQSAAITLEFARMQMLKNGTVYSPNGTVDTNYYTEFGVTRDVIPLNLNSTTDNPITLVGDVYGEVQDSVQSGDIVTDIVALCSPSFFAALTGNAFVTESFSAFVQPQSMELLNGRLDTRSPLDRRYRVFDYGGVLWVEVRGGVGGVPYVEPGEAYIFPRGTDSFRTFFAPAEKFASVNQPAQEVYMFSTMGVKDDKIELELESNFANALVRPQIVKTLTIGA